MNGNLIHKKSSVGFKIIDGKAFLIFLEASPAANEVFYILNDTGTRIWQLINGKRTRQDIAKMIAEEFGLKTAEAITETVVFIKQLLSKGLAVYS